VFIANSLHFFRVSTAGSAVVDVLPQFAAKFTLEDCERDPLFIFSARFHNQKPSWRNRRILRRFSNPLNSRDFTVPTLHPRAAAISSIEFST
jgi:hypothetical protein